MKIHLIAGARPNYVKIAALFRALQKHKRKHRHFNLIYRLIHTGQHYDFLMSKKIFQDLNIPNPYVDLNVGSSTHAIQTAKIMARFEKVIEKDRPDIVVVVGDVNSTMACSLVAAKMRIPVAHVEAGLRSFDRDMPEEINRLVTDVVSDFLFTSCRDADQNLIREGISRKKIYFVGNVMVDTLLANLAKARRSSVLKRHGIKGPYAVLTLHRPSNVDKESDFSEILLALEKIQQHIPIIFPVHPRTAKKLKQKTLLKRTMNLPNIRFVPPLGYLDFICLMSRASLVLTDSGGIQEETTVLGIPCVTLRDNTERPVTISEGTNILAGRRSDKIVGHAFTLLKKKKKGKSQVPLLWDGNAANRIVSILSKKMGF